MLTRREFNSNSLILLSSRWSEQENLQEHKRRTSTVSSNKVSFSTELCTFLVMSKPKHNWTGKRPKAIKTINQDEVL